MHQVDGRVVDDDGGDAKEQVGLEQVTRLEEDDELAGIALGGRMREGCRDITLGRFANWGDPERMVVNVASLYREFGSPQELDVLQLFGEMGRYHAELKAKAAPHDHAHGHQHAHS